MSGGKKGLRAAVEPLPAPIDTTSGGRYAGSPRNGDRCPAHEPRSHELRGQGVSRASPARLVDRRAGGPPRRTSRASASTTCSRPSSTRALRRPGPGRSSKYAAVAPELALERLVSDQREQLADLERADGRADRGAEPGLPRRAGAGEPARVHRGAARPARDQRALRGAAGRHQATRSSSSRSRRTRRLRRRTSRGSRSTKTHQARSVYELSIFDDPDDDRGRAPLRRGRRGWRASSRSCR